VLSVALSLAVLAGGCPATGAHLPALSAETAGSYRLDPGDQVRISVFNDARLTRDFRVADTGALAVPLVGLVLVQGRATEEAARLIENALRAKRLYNKPSVALEILEYRPVFVLGMVERGGQLPYQPGLTVLVAIAVVGGFNFRANTDYVGLTRIGEDGRAQEYRAPRSALLRPSDVMNVFERRF
jgi:polysaccharide export outer membrane protein